MDQYREYQVTSWLAGTPEKALKGVRKLMADILLDMDKNDEPIPEPTACKHYSGKFMVRVPPDRLKNGIFGVLSVGRQDH